MVRKPTTVNQLFAPSAFRPRVMADALRVSHADVCIWCEQTKSKYSVAQLCQTIAEKLPDMLEVGLAELIARRWLTMRALGDDWPQSIDLDLHPSFELTRHGMLGKVVDIDVRIGLTGLGGTTRTIRLEPSGRQLQFPNPSGWRCLASLAFSAPRNMLPTVFARTEGDIVLPDNIPTRADYDGP